MLACLPATCDDGGLTADEKEVAALRGHASLGEAAYHFAATGERRQQSADSVAQINQLMEYDDNAAATTTTTTTNSSNSTATPTDDHTLTDDGTENTLHVPVPLSIAAFDTFIGAEQLGARVHWGRMVMQFFFTVGNSEAQPGKLTFGFKREAVFMSESENLRSPYLLCAHVVAYDAERMPVDTVFYFKTGGAEGADEDAQQQQQQQHASNGSTTMPVPGLREEQQAQHQ